MKEEITNQITSPEVEESWLSNLWATITRKCSAVLQSVCNLFSRENAEAAVVAVRECKLTLAAVLAIEALAVAAATTLISGWVIGTVVAATCVVITVVVLHLTQG